MTGKIKALYPTFGFITADDGGGEFFFHQTDEVGAGIVGLVVGDRVTFEPVDPAPEKGPRARDVSFLSAGNQTTNSAQEATQ